MRERIDQCKTVWMFEIKNNILDKLKEESKRRLLEEKLSGEMASQRDALQAEMQETERQLKAEEESKMQALRQSMDNKLSSELDAEKRERILSERKLKEGQIKEEIARKKTEADLKAKADIEAKKMENFQEIQQQEQRSLDRLRQKEQEEFDKWKVVTALFRTAFQSCRSLCENVAARTCFPSRTRVLTVMKMGRNPRGCCKSSWITLWYLNVIKRHRQF